MLIGHYGPAFAIKAIDKKIPLWMLFIAVQTADIIWGTQILLGIAKAGINPSQASNPLQLSYMPYSHGLLSALLYSIVIVAVLLLVPYFRKNKSTAWWLGLATFSHWILDFISHRPDLPIYGDNLKVGLGLWNYPTWAVIISTSRGDAMAVESANMVALSALAYYALSTLIIYLVERNERIPN